jgi:hypothetical protein
MRLRRKREPISPEPSYPVAIEPDDLDVKLPTLWSVEQLSTLRPVTGPSHRTFVPIVRSTAMYDALTPEASLSVTDPFSNQSTPTLEAL